MQLHAIKLSHAAGEKRDSIDHWAAEVRRLETEIVAARQAVLDAPPSGSFIVLFHTQRDAAIAAQTRLHSDDGHAFRVTECPGPEEVRTTCKRMAAAENCSWMLAVALLHNVSQAA